MGNICVIGPRNSGKTTYLAALAYWPDKKRAGKGANSFNIQPLNEDAKELAYKAENIICEGATLAPTEVAWDVDALPYYSFKLEIGRKFGKPAEVNLAVRDYPGEIFEGLESGQTNSLQEDYINECLMKDVNGCLILLTDWQKGTDKFYRRVLEQFTKLMDIHERTNDLRLAVAMSKCERGELWPCRLEPELDLFDVHLPKTKATLQNKIPANNLQFYAMSTFGVLQKNDPRPNRVEEIGTGGRCSVLRNPSLWRPYNMVAPLCWLSNGRRMKADA